MPCFATAGLAEWEIKTPGGNLISHVDPLINANGTCLRSARPESIHVAHLDWWRYYRNAVVGKSKNGFFIFVETSHSVSFFVSLADLDVRLRAADSVFAHAAKAIEIEDIEVRVAALANQR